MKILTLITILLSFTSCAQNNSSHPIAHQETVQETKVFTLKSENKNTNINFNSPKAINAIADIENEYFNAYSTAQSRYYGTIWKQNAEVIYSGDSISEFSIYKNQMAKRKIEPDSMHCTIYATKALAAGFGSTFIEVDNYHKEIWGDREYAGWSIAHILTKHYGWKAYLFISEESHEYEACKKNYKNDKTYHVWRQPNIKLSGYFDMEKDTTAIENLLADNEFGWGFSDQGWHTWITRYNQLKECNWAGAPSNANDYGSNPLFLKTKLIDYNDYQSHIVVFPPNELP